MPYYDPNNRALKNLTAHIHTRTFWGENLLAGIVDLEANAALPEHSHPHEQITYIISGELHFDLNGEKRTLIAGELVVIPGGAPHSAQVGPQGCQAFDVFSPPREDMKY